MKIKKLLALIIICAFVLTGCNSDKKYNEYMENGEQAVKQEQYKEALDDFSSALDEKEGDDEATSLYNQVEKLIQVQAKIKNKLYDEAIDLCDEIISSDSDSQVAIDQAKKLKQQSQNLKQEQENLTFKEDIEKRMNEVKEFINKEEYMKAKVKLGYIIDEISDKPAYSNQFKECNELLKKCNDKLDEISKKKAEETKKQNESTSNKNDSNKQQSNSNKQQNNTINSGDDINFNDELKKQIAVAGESYVEFYFEYGEQTAPSKFAEKAYEDTENDTPLGKYKEEGRKIFMNSFKEAYEATGNEYY